ncbi:metal ABC transporter ATP-binding protein [Vulgatibacter sp.]|uniref:metal ABC transporter ATP-binding protein n=1 Tax=Vulgatibacter sp. TaxID=1971226 RepID=UPI003563627A
MHAPDKPGPSPAQQRRPLIELQAIQTGYGKRPLSPPFDFTVRSGDVIVLAGPNGAGKSTLARTLMGVLPPVAGTRRAGTAARPVRFGYVPQRERLDDLWPFSVLDIALMGAVPGLGAFRPFGRARQQKALAVLAQVGIADLASSPFRSLSGGQQQRALIARALVAEPDVLVLDEPTNHLDIPGERAVYELLAQLRREEAEKAIFVITHHLESALAIATEVVVMRQGERPRIAPVDEMVASGALDDLRIARFERRAS